jgi:hypothetical protein
MDIHVKDLCTGRTWCYADTYVYETTQFYKYYWFKIKIKSYYGKINCLLLLISESDASEYDNPNLCS